MRDWQRLGFLVIRAPVLWIQGKYVRKVTPRLPEPDGERAGEMGQGPTLRLLLTGDSAAAGVGASSQALALSGQLVPEEIGLFSEAEQLRFGYMLSASIFLNKFSIVLNGLQLFSIFSMKDTEVCARCADVGESVLTPFKSEPNDGLAPRAGNGLAGQDAGHFRKVPAEVQMVTNGH